jgi:hypothetical protein
MGVIVMLCPNASGQWVRTNGLNHDFVVALAVSGGNLLASVQNAQDMPIWYTVLSTDNGASWSWISPSLGNPMVSAFAVIGTNVFAGTVGGTYRSTDSGVSWTRVDSIPGADCFAVSRTYLFAAGGARVFGSTDYGTRWTEVDSGLTDGVRSLVVSRTNLFAGTAGSGVFLSTNNGTSWAQVNSGLTHRNIWSLAAYDTNIFAVTDSGGFVSTNCGTSWTPMESDLIRMVILCLGGDGTNIIKAIGRRSLPNGIFSSTNNGTTWIEADSGLYLPVTCLTADATNLYAGTNDGVWFRPVSELFTSVGTSSAQSPTAFELFQNYPNPFNPTTKIQFTIVNRQLTTIKVFDLLGKEVATLVNEVKEPGTYTVQFDGSKLPSGVYFYRLQAGNFVQTKRILLLK